MSPPVDREKMDLAASFDYYGARLWWTYQEIAGQMGEDTWKGRAADDFRAVMQRFKREIDGLMPAYRQTAVNIRQKYNAPVPAPSDPGPTSRRPGTAF